MDAARLMAAPQAKGKGSGLKRKVFGMPVWMWGAVIVGGVLIGVYLRRRSAGAGSSSSTMDGQDTSALGAGASPSDNGLGSSSTDLQGFLDAQGQLLQEFGDQLSQTLATQSSANGGEFGPSGTSGDGGGGGGDGGGDTTSTEGVTLAPGNTGDLNLSLLTPASIKAAWAAYAQQQKKTGIITSVHQIPYSTKGTTVKVPGGAFTQVSAAPKRAATAARKTVAAIFVPAKKGQRAHWALPSGSWVAGPGRYPA